MSARVLRLYRLTVEKWPTPNGEPFDRQSSEFWEAITDAFYNPGSDNLMPEWLPNNIEDWLDTPGDSWSPSCRAYMSGRYYEHAALVVPMVSRRHWQTRAAAQRKADVFALWGCTVRIDASEPIVWADA